MDYWQFMMRNYKWQISFIIRLHLNAEK